MNSDTTFTISTTGSVATRRLGQRLGRLLGGGEMIELSSDIGGGKTTLAQGIAAGMGYDGEVSSPTFTLSRVYPAHRGLTLHHFDLYRLTGRDMVTDELDEAVGDPHSVIVVEWAEQGRLRLPKDRLQVTLTQGEDANRRDIRIRGTGSDSARIVKGLSK